jgi:hypothetical protein
VYAGSRMFDLLPYRGPALHLALFLI